MSAIVEMMGAIVILAVIGAGVVNIIKASKMPGGSKIVRSRIEDLEADEALFPWEKLVEQALTSVEVIDLDRSG